MKTTIELPDALLARAKSVAAERRTTLKAMIEHALYRELLEAGLPGEPETRHELNEHGFPVLRAKDKGRTRVTSAAVYKLLDAEEA